jgi:hypothetical protein
MCIKSLKFGWFEFGHGKYVNLYIISMLYLKPSLKPNTNFVLLLNKIIQRLS